jgi:hypothetical protein
MRQGRAPHRMVFGASRAVPSGLNAKAVELPVQTLALFNPKAADPGRRGFESQ